MHSLDEVFSLSAALQQAVLNAPLPPELEREITESVAEMQRRAGPDDAVTKERVLEYIKRCTKALKQLGVSGKMAVAGLNPHSGEHGLFGNEEVKEITPAIEEAQKLGYDVVGPIGADSVFHQALQGRYVAVLSLYHDQGHIATKTYDFERTIAITLDMPILRTSVDHGTAFDIAGKGIVSAVSMIEAVKLAAKYAPNFKNIK